MERKNNLLSVGSSPHITSSEDTRSIMLDVIIALAPALVFGIYLFGWRVLAMTLISSAACIAFEFIYQYLMKRTIRVTDLSATVTGILIVFVLPASVPYWMLIVGDFFAIVVVKQLFGGIGKNFMNPALAARVFLTSWAALLNTYPAISVASEFTDLPVIGNVKMINGIPDIISSATPLASMKSGILPNTSLFEMAIGVIPGCVGEVSAFLLILGGLYLLIRKVITVRIPLSFIATVALLTLVFPPEGINAFTWMLYSILSGGVMLGAIFMATDYSTSPVSTGAQWIFGAGCGLITFVIRYFGAYNEGVAYSILIMNSLVWLLDKYIRPRRFGTGKKAARKAAEVMAAIKASKVPEVSNND